MGVFDTIHIEGRHHQTKALGHGYGDYTVGDSVEIKYRSTTQEEYELAPAHKYVPAPVDFSFQATSSNRGGDPVSILVRDGKIVGYGEHLENRFDSHGRSVGPVHWSPEIVEDPVWVRCGDETSKTLAEYRQRHPERFVR